MSSKQEQPPGGNPNDGRSPAPSSDSRPTSPPARNNHLTVPGTNSRGASLDQQPSPVSDEETLVARPSHAEDDEDEDPLRPDPNNEAEFNIENNVFAFSPGQLGKLLNPKSLSVFRAIGGLDGLSQGLRSDRLAGLSLDETKLEGKVSYEDVTGNAARNDVFARPAAPARASTGAHPQGRQHNDSYSDRLRVFGDNRLPEKKSKGLLELMWIALMDKVLLLLSAAAVISLALGLYQTFGVKHEAGEAKVEWVEGVAIIVAIAIVVCVGAGNDYQKERQFVRLNKKKEDRTVKVVRSGKSMEISIYDLLVGDVIHMEPGDLLPADGIFISGHNVKCDESSATGESDQMKKTPGDEVMKQLQENTPGNHKLDPFIISGGKVLEGVGTYMVTAVGVHSSHGKIMMAFREESTATPLQMKLNDLAEAIAKLGGASALLLFIVLFIRFLVQLKGNTALPSVKAQNFMRILITAITVVVVAVPEGLPLAVTLALAFATTRMLKDNNLVRVLQSCETMGNATTICSDKTGTLTQNRMTVVAGTIGINTTFSGKQKAPAVKMVEGEEVNEKDTNGVSEEVVSNGISTVINNLSSEYKGLLLQSIVQNSTAFEGAEGGNEAFIGSKTETALLQFARDYLNMGPIAEERSDANIAQMIPFDSARKCMGVVLKMPDGRYRMFVKGASEIVLRACSKIVEVQDHLSEAPLTEELVKEINETITTYATRSLRTIGLLYRDFDAWPSKGARTSPDDPTQVEFEDVFEQMTWIGLVGIQDPLRDGVPEAVAQCQKAGVFVRMVTGDNIITAKAIAEECGIYTQGGVVMEGPKFRQLSQQQMDQIIPRLQVLARSSPDDKRILVRRLKELGETVAVTGDGTNDGPALKMADVGFSMGIAGTEVAKEASSIILMDDNFSSIVKALMWGRAVNDAVKKFLQFQLTVNITAVLLTFITAVASTDERSVLSAVQLLWVNLIMDTFAALALATDPPTPSILDRKPDPKSAPLITVNMWKMIIGQAVYQLVVSLVLHFAGKSILGMDATDTKGIKRETLELKALVFNAFVWMQIFNQFNNRRLDNKFNIFEGIQHNWFFIGINFVMIGGQVMIMFVGGRAFSVTKLSGSQWGISIILGVLSLPIAVIIRLIPDAAAAKLMPNWMTKKRKPRNVYVTDDRFEWNRGIEEIRDELAFLKLVRGGRLNQLKFQKKNITETMKENFSHLFRSGSKSGDNGAEFGGVNQDGTLQPPPSPGSNRRRRSRSNSAFAAAAMVPSIVAGSIGGWSPVERPATGDEAAPFKEKEKKEEGKEEGLTVPSTRASTESPAPSQQGGSTPDVQQAK